MMRHRTAPNYRCGCWRGFGRTLSLVFALLPLTASATCKVFWQPSDFVQSNQPRIELTHKNRTLTTLPTSWFIAVNHIHRRINAVSEVDSRLLLCADAEPNAFAGHDESGAMVALTLGMVELLDNDWDAYAAILGHENAHLARQHGAKRQQRAAWSQIGQLLIGGVSSGGAAYGAQLGLQAVDSGYSQKDEYEADQDGMRYAYLAGFDPRGALTFHAKIKSASSFLASHPSSADRIRRLKAELRRWGW